MCAQYWETKTVNLFRSFFLSPGLIWDPEAPLSDASMGKSGAFIVYHIVTLNIVNSFVCVYGCMFNPVCMIKIGRGRQTGREAIMPQKTLKIAKMAITQISRVFIFLLVHKTGGN